jgi:hypothetical protein
LKLTLLFRLFARGKASILKAFTSAFIIFEEGHLLASKRLMFYKNSPTAFYQKSMLPSG